VDGTVTLTRAIELRREIAEISAYAGLAETYITGDNLDPKVSIPLARAAAAKGLALDDAVSDAHVAAAQVKYVGDWDWKGSEKEFKRAIELNPGDVLAHHLYSHLLRSMGRNQESLRESELRSIGSGRAFRVRPSRFPLLSG
jgi:hypothetical protein